MAQHDVGGDQGLRLSLAERLHKPPEWLPADLAQPDVIGPYRLRKTIGQGAFAKVKQAIHEKTSTQVSVKIMSKGKIKESYVWKHLYREGQIHGMMDHPNIIKLLHVFENEGGYYMVTELASGGEVLDYIVAHRHLNEKETRKLVRQLASGVEYMNRMGVVHRDLKAENLLLDANLNLQIIDFGLSNAVEGTAQFLETQCGSPSYSAPELLAGEAYTQEVDVWSIGVNMYAMLTGKLPYPGEDIPKLYPLMMNDEFPMPPKLSTGCKDLLAQLLKGNPADRIKITDVLEHEWVVQEHGPLLPHNPKPMPRCGADLHLTTLNYMATTVEDKAKVIDSVCNQEYDSLASMYHLIAAKIVKYEEKKAEAKAKKSRRTSKLSRSVSDSVAGIIPSTDTIARNDSLLSDGVFESSSGSAASATTTTDEKRGFRKARGAGARLRFRRSSSNNNNDPDSPEAVAQGEGSQRVRTTSGGRPIPLDESAGPAVTALAKKTSSRGGRLSTRAQTDNALPAHQEDTEHQPNPREHGRSSRRSRLSSGGSSDDGSGVKLPDIGSAGSGTSRTPHGDLHDAASSEYDELIATHNPKKLESFRAPISKDTVSTKHPDTLKADLQSVLLRLKFAVLEGEEWLGFSCRRDGVFFDAEIIKVPGLRVHQIIFHRLKGNAEMYRKLCSEVLTTIEMHN